MGYEMPDRPKFLEQALQGLAFWVGHRRSLFHAYHIPEAALVTEASNLIQANLSQLQILRPEVLYRRIVQVDGSELTDLSRADLVILSANSPNPYEENDVSSFVQFVIEVKRASASTESINRDLRRLYQFKRNCKTEARAFLVVASEALLPERFVEEESGTSRLHRHDIPEYEGCYHIRRTVKAAASFEKKETAHYVCIVEVFATAPKKLPNF